MADNLPVKQGFMEDDMESMMMIMMMLMMSMVMSGVLAGVNTQSTRSAGVVGSAITTHGADYDGINDPRTVNVTAAMSYLDFINEKPYQPWMIAYIVNDGPYPVNVSINYPSESFSIDAGATRTINRSGAAERIGVLFFKCEPGQRAVVRITGEY